MSLPVFLGVTSLLRCLERPNLRSVLEVIAGARADPQADSVELVEELGELERCRAGSVVVLGRAASAASATYRFDVAMRMARAREIAGLVLIGDEPSTITTTAAGIAERAGIVVARTRVPLALGELAIRLAREINGDAESAFAEVVAAHELLEALPPGTPWTTFTARVEQTLGFRLDLVDEQPPATSATPIVVDGTVEHWLRPRDTAAPSHAADAQRIVTAMTATRIAAALADERRARELPALSQREVLSEIIGARGTAALSLLRRGRSLGMPIDGWHVGVQMEVDAIDDAAGEPELALLERRRALAEVTLQALRSKGGADWYATNPGSALLFVRMHPEDPGSTAAQDVTPLVQLALDRVRRRVGELQVHSGISSVHAGSIGLLAAVAEARAAAAAARVRGPFSPPVLFDGTGLRRTLLEWYASDTAREAVASALAPLERLGGQRAETAIQTLQAYLDNQGSLSRTAEQLNLHRNGVTYRLEQIFELLDVDRDNADDRLLLQMACRARSLA